MAGYRLWPAFWRIASVCEQRQRDPCEKFGLKRMAPLQRLTRRAEFLMVAAGRRKSVAPGLILQAYPQAAADAIRVGFTASRKVGNAVARNRARRRLRAAAAQIMTAHAVGGHDYVMIARAGTLTRPYEALLADLAAGLKRLGAYRK